MKDKHVYALVFTGESEPAVVDVCEQDWHAETVSGDGDR